MCICEPWPWWSSSGGLRWFGTADAAIALPDPGLRQARGADPPDCLVDFIVKEKVGEIEKTRKMAFGSQGIERDGFRTIIRWLVVVV